MLRRLTAFLPGLLLLLSVGAGSTAAKEGMQARLDAPIPIDTPPGTTIQVGWSTVVPTGAGTTTVPFSGAPVFIALRSPEATEPESVVFGHEQPAGSGHFTASIVVPAGGIAADGLTIGLRGEICENGRCVRNVMPFELVGEVLSTSVAAVPGASVEVTRASVAPLAVPAAPTASEPAGDATPWLGLVIIGAAVGVSGVLLLVAPRARQGVPVTRDAPIPGEPAPASTIELVTD